MPTARLAARLGSAIYPIVEITMGLASFERLSGRQVRVTYPSVLSHAEIHEDERKWLYMC